MVYATVISVSNSPCCAPEYAVARFLPQIDFPKGESPRISPYLRPPAGVVADSGLRQRDVHGDFGTFVPRITLLSLDFMNSKSPLPQKRRADSAKRADGRRSGPQRHRPRPAPGHTPHLTAIRRRNAPAWPPKSPRPTRPLTGTDTCPAAGQDPMSHRMAHQRPGLGAHLTYVPDRRPRRCPGTSRPQTEAWHSGSL